MPSMATDIEKNSRISDAGNVRQFVEWVGVAGDVLKCCPGLSQWFTQDSVAQALQIDCLNHGL